VAILRQNKKRKRKERKQAFTIFVSIATYIAIKTEIITKELLLFFF
jgi:hypothetical protein